MNEAELSTVALAIAVSYGFGVLWYTVLSQKFDSWMRIAALPLVGLVIAQGLWNNSSWSGPEFLDLNIVAVVVGTSIGALTDVFAQTVSRESYVPKSVGAFTHLFRTWKITKAG